MDVHANDWSELAGRLANNYGEAFEPDRRKELRPKLVRVLTRELGDVERDHVVASLDDVLRRTKVTIDWNRFLCIILSSLPGTWTKLTNNPGFNASTMLLLLDGTVMCQQEGGLNWKKLTPDSSGSYLNGTWSDLAPMHWTRRYYASAVLKDGRVFVSGGEYSERRQRDEQVRDLRPAHGHVDGDLAAARLLAGSATRRARCCRTDAFFSGTSTRRRRRSTTPSPTPGRPGR